MEKENHCVARYCEFWMEDNVRSRGWNPLPASPPLTHNFFHFFKGGGAKAPPLVWQGGGPKFSNGLSWPQSASAGLDLPQQFWGQCGVAADSMLASNCLSYWPPICSLKMSGSLPFAICRWHCLLILYLLWLFLMLFFLQLNVIFIYICFIFQIKVFIFKLLFS